MFKYYNISELTEVLQNFRPLNEFINDTLVNVWMATHSSPRASH